MVVADASESGYAVSSDILNRQMVIVFSYTLTMCVLLPFFPLSTELNQTLLKQIKHIRSSVISQNNIFRKKEQVTLIVWPQW